MSGDFEHLSAVRSLASAELENGELAFTFPDVLRIIEICSVHEIAVLGIELFRIDNGKYQTIGFSEYDIRADDWSVYLAENVRAAKGFVESHPLGDDCVYMLTTASQNEFRQLRGHRN